MNHVTQAKRTLKTLLQTQLPTALLLADADAGDNIVTPPPYEIFTTDKADLGGLPSVELIVTDSSPTADSYAMVYRHRVVIGVTVGGDVEETISIQIERYLWAFRKVIKDYNLTPFAGTGPLGVGGEQYTPLQQRPQTVENPMVKGGFIEVFITTVE